MAVRVVAGGMGLLLLYLQQTGEGGVGVGEGTCWYFFNYCTAIQFFQYRLPFLSFLSSAKSSSDDSLLPFSWKRHTKTTRVDVPFNKHSNNNTYVGEHLQVNIQSRLMAPYLFKEVGTFCGYNSPPPIVVKQTFLWNIYISDAVLAVFYFQSDSSANGRGFNVSYFYSSKYVSVITYCFVSYTVYI